MTNSMLYAAEWQAPRALPGLVTYSRELVESA